MIVLEKDEDDSDDYQKTILDLYELQTTIADYQEQDANLKLEIDALEKSISDASDLLKIREEELKNLEELIERKRHEHDIQVKKAIEIVNQQLSFILIKQVIIHSLK